MIAAQIVRTVGINWESVGVIVAAVGVIVALVVPMVVWLSSRRDRRSENALDLQRAANVELKQDFTDAINHLSDILTAKLETKETVAQISVRLARLEGAAASAPAMLKPD